MKLAIIGVTGNVGSRILDEALRRGHSVKGIARDFSMIAPRERLTLVAADADNPATLAPLLAGSEAVISSLPFRTSDPAKLIDAARRSGVKRYLVVGGAASLEAAPGKLLLNSPGFPESAWEEATRGKEFLDALRQVNDLDWTMLSPSALFIAGKRTGVFRLGGNALLTGADGKSWISYEDFAIALLDEVEQPQHSRQRFTVGY